MSSSCKPNISKCLIFLGCVHGSLALALPSTQTPNAAMVTRRANAEIATQYGFFGSSNSDDKDTKSRDPYLAHIPEVFMAMAQQTDGSLMSPLTLAPDATPTESLFEEGVTAYPTAPPAVGPGVVLLSTGAISGLTAATPLPTGSTTAPLTGKRPSQRALILGSVIGSILLFTLFLFIVLDPAITVQLCGICSVRRKPAKKNPKEESKEADTTVEKDITWADALAGPTPNLGDDTFVEGEKPLPKIDKEEGTLLDPTSSQRKASSQSPPSKFSMCSSEYSESPRNSALSSNSAYVPTKSATVSFKPGPTPVRPPRPPTADSPALSESVYLANACAEQPYVVVAPRPITEADMKTTPRRIMTPSEFFALHAPNVLASLSSSSKKHDTSISRKDNATLSAGKRESFHMRTISAPLLGPAKTLSCTSNSEFDSDTDVAFQAPMIKRIARHRKSRSASGWAYPDRPGSRAQVRDEMIEA